jgi:hypothetical protein
MGLTPLALAVFPAILVDPPFDSLHLDSMLFANSMQLLSMVGFETLDDLFKLQLLRLVQNLQACTRVLEASFP